MDSYDNIGQKIKELRQSKDMTLEELGNAVGVTKSTVRKWENGMIANMRRDKIAVLAKALGVSPAALLGWDDLDDVAPASNVYKIERKSFPVFESIACGDPIYADDHIEGYIEAGSDIKADFCVIAKGDSMIGDRIFDGDVVFVKKQSVVENGEVAAVLIGDEATLKRVVYDHEAGILQLFPSNPAHKIQTYSGEDLNQIRILGKAVKCQFDLNQ